MFSPRPLRERSLEELLWHAVAAREDGLVTLRDRDGNRHGVWVQAGYVVGIRVSGRFDPLLDLLKQKGELDPRAFQACVDGLYRGVDRAGTVAMSVGGVSRPSVRDALKEQACKRMAALLELAAQRGHDAWLESCAVPPEHVSVRMPLGALLRHAPVAPAPVQAEPQDRAAARRRLRELAKRLHPDRNIHLDQDTRARLERDLANATARYHGFA